MSGTGLRMGTPEARWVLSATILGSGIAMLDSTVVTVALERIGRDFDASFGALQWVVTGYTLTLAALILLGGSLGDRFGRRRVFVVGTTWFAVASLLCGLAPSAELLIAARALQGVGGALLTPGSLALISASFAAGERAKAIGAWSGLGGLAAAIGPFAGGWLVQWNWRAVFLVNLPIAAVVVWITRRHVPESRDPGASVRLDVPGTLLAVAGLGLLTYASIMAGDRGVGPVVLVVAAAGLVALGAFVAVERRSPHPLVPLGLFRNTTFTAANLATFLVYGALGVSVLMLVLQLQVVAGFSPLAAGTALLPVTVLLLALSTSAGALSGRIGPRVPMTVGPLVSAVGLVLALRVGPGASYLLDVMPAVVVFGLGLALTVAPLTATVLEAADSRHAGIASGVNNAVARAAALLAVAVVPVVAGLGGTAYTDPAAFDGGFRTAILVAAGLLAAGGLVALVGIRGGSPRRADPDLVPSPAAGFGGGPTADRG